MFEFVYTLLIFENKNCGENHIKKHEKRMKKRHPKMVKRQKRENKGKKKKLALWISKR